MSTHEAAPGVKLDRAGASGNLAFHFGRLPMVGERRATSAGPLLKWSDRAGSACQARRRAMDAEEPADPWGTGGL
jgi:hypothetical protein